MLDATERATHAPVEKLSGWQVCQPELLYVSVDGVGHAGRYTVGIRGICADVWSPHTVLGRGVPCRRIVASSHGLGCEYGCRDQQGRHEGHFGHLFLHTVAGAKEALSSS
jgi:hypothetical protein